MNLLTLFSLGVCDDHIPLYISVYHFYRKGSIWLKSLWQYYLDISWAFDKGYFDILLLKMWEIYILKNLVCNSWYFQAFFFKPWSRGKHSWLWICSPGFKSRPGPRFSKLFSFFAITLTKYWWSMTLSLQKSIFWRII